MILHFYKIHFNKIIQQRAKYFNNNFVKLTAKYSKITLTFVYI